MKNTRDKIIILTVLTIIFTLMGSTFAWLSWRSGTNTTVAFTVTSDFSCSADGGGNITSNEKPLAPTDDCTGAYAIQRTVKTSVVKSGTSNVYMDLWLNVVDIDDELSVSENLRYVLSTSSTSCSGNSVVKEGTFTGRESGDKVNLLSGSQYTATDTDTYYLYIWLDYKEENPNTMNKNFELSLGGSCANNLVPKPNVPVLDDGMIPVTIANNGTVTTVSETDSNWYNYEEKQWANAVLVKQSGTQSRSYYQTHNNVTVNQDDILGYYVWIPRYRYAMPVMSCSNISNVSYTDYPECYRIIVDQQTKEMMINLLQLLMSSEGLDATMEDATAIVEEGLETGVFEVIGIKFTMEDANDLFYEAMGSRVEYELQYAPNNTVTIIDSINIEFEDNNATKSTGTAIGTSYRTHPAFTFGNEELDGIWVGKFETTQGTSNNVGTSNPTVLPNTASWRSQNVSTQFTTSQKFSASGNNYGLNNSVTDSHMMKNSEWGAVAYLSHSKYGINGEIRINNNSKYTTGCGADVDNDSSTSNCEIAYGGATSYPQSTTGNISGIFDMSGGAWEYVMGVLADDSGKPRSGYSDSWNSGFNGIVYNDGSESLYQSGINFPDSKYYDLYMTEDPTTACNGGMCYGHALSETSGWYSDYAGFVDAGYPWFIRGGYYGTVVGAGAF